MPVLIHWWLRVFFYLSLNYQLVIINPTYRMKGQFICLKKTTLTWSRIVIVPLKSKLPPSRETRLSSRETRLSSLETRLSSREMRLSSRERLKNTVSTKTCRSRELKTSIVRRNSKFCSLTWGRVVTKQVEFTEFLISQAHRSQTPLSDRKLNRFENVYLQKLIESFEFDHLVFLVRSDVSELIERRAYFFCV